MSFSLLRQASPCSMAVRSLRRRPHGHRTSAPRSRSAVATLTTVLWTSSWRCSGRLLRRGRLRTKPWRFCGSGLTNPVTRRPGRQRLLVKLWDRQCAQRLRWIAWGDRSGVRRSQLFAQRIDVRGSVLFLGLLAGSSCACGDRNHEQYVITCTFVCVSLRVFQFVPNVRVSVCVSALSAYVQLYFLGVDRGRSLVGSLWRFRSRPQGLSSAGTVLLHLVGESQELRYRKTSQLALVQVAAPFCSLGFLSRWAS